MITNIHVQQIHVLKTSYFNNHVNFQEKKSTTDPRVNLIYPNLLNLTKKKSNRLFKKRLRKRLISNSKTFISYDIYNNNF